MLVTVTRRHVATALLVGATLALAACGSSGGTKAAPATSKQPRPSLGDQVCAAYTHAVRATDAPSVQARKALAALATVHPAAADRARYQAVVAAYRDVEHTWADTAPTTPAAFAAANKASSTRYTQASEAAGASPCPRPTAGTTTTTAAGPTKPTWAYNTIDRPTSGDGLWIYFDASCPSGKTLTGVVAPWQSNPGAPGVSYAAQPFTAAAADAAFGARPPFSGSCT
jgi:hypothetical protein